MQLYDYIVGNAVVLIPALIIIGQIIKVTPIPNKYIPLILLPIGVVGAMAIVGWTVDGAIQGVLITGAAVYGNQIYKQLRKDDNDE